MGIGTCTAAKVSINADVLPDLNLSIEDKPRKSCPEFKQAPAKLNGQKFANNETRVLAKRAKFFADRRPVEDRYSPEVFASRLRPGSDDNKQDVTLTLRNKKGEKVNLEMPGVLTMYGGDAKLPPKGSGYRMVEMNEGGRKAHYYLNEKQYARYQEALKGPSTKGRNSRQAQVEIEKATVKQEKGEAKPLAAPKAEGPKVKDPYQARLDGILAKATVTKPEAAQGEPNLAGYGFEKSPLKGQIIED